MAEWLVEDGIGEERAILVERGEVIAARVRWPGEIEAGAVLDAVLTSRAAGSRRGTAQLADGTEMLVDGLPQEASEGAAMRLQVRRAALAERGRFKRALARPSDEEPHRVTGLGALPSARTVQAFPAGLWEDITADARTGLIAFAGGSLTISPTPAMTVIDIDGDLPPRALALAAVPTLAAALRRLDLGGSIGIDFPSLSEKADRKAVDEALARAVADWPHERTAMNGFGLVHLVARLSRPSLLHRFAFDRVAAEARLLLRRAERVTEPGALLIRTNPLVRQAISADWEAQLARRTARQIRWELDPALALESGFAQAVPI